ATVFFRSMAGEASEMPSGSEPEAISRTLRYSSAAWISALEGMQPTLRQVPPGLTASTMTVSIPSCPARMAQTYPPGPAPMTSSLQEISFIASALHKQQRRGFQQRLQPLHEDGRVPAIDHAMVEGRRQVHHLARQELRAVPDRSHHDLVDTDNGDFGMVDDRRGRNAAQRAERGDGAGGAGQFLARRRSRTRGLRQRADLGGAIPQIAGLGMAQHRHDETRWRLRRDADMDAGMAMDDAGLIVIKRVDLRLFGHGP